MQRIVHMHGGTITADSPGRGGGSTFVVRLPIGELEVTGEERRGSVQFRDVLAPGASRPAAGQRRILIVDDNVDAADSLARVLSSMEHQLRVVYSGHDAIKAYSEFAPDIVFMDISMPDMNGLQTIAAIRAMPEGGRALICTLSGHGATHAGQAFAAGADGHLVKPVGRADLTAVLERA